MQEAPAKSAQKTNISKETTENVREPLLGWTPCRMGVVRCFDMDINDARYNTLDQSLPENIKQHKMIDNAAIN